jgi:hypothetical protein
MYIVFGPVYTNGVFTKTYANIVLYQEERVSEKTE